MSKKPPAKDRLAALPGTSSKTRLRKLVCSDGCGYPPLRCSRLAIERGLPVCPCGALMWPWDLEDVELAAAAGSLPPELRDIHPLVVEFRRAWDGITRGQHGHQKRGSDALDSPDALATLRVAEGVRADNARARLNAARAGGEVKAARELSKTGAVGASRPTMTKDNDPIPF